LRHLPEGVFKYHAVQWAAIAISTGRPGQASDFVQETELDRLFQAMTRQLGLRRFKQGISLICDGRLTSKNTEMMFLLGSCSLLQIENCTPAVVDFVYYVFDEEHTIESLSKLEESGHTFHHEDFFVDLGISDHFNTQHLSHAPDVASIFHSHGFAGGDYIEASERLYVEAAE
ncbi:hypothetical protein F5146DRAFT_904298, partial [Armillaria mellea]